MFVLLILAGRRRFVTKHYCWATALCNSIAHCVTRQLIRDLNLLTLLHNTLYIWYSLHLLFGSKYSDAVLQVYKRWRTLGQKGSNYYHPLRPERFDSCVSRLSTFVIDEHHQKEFLNFSLSSSNTWLHLLWFVLTFILIDVYVVYLSKYNIRRRRLSPFVWWSFAMIFPCALIIIRPCMKRRDEYIRRRWQMRRRPTNFGTTTSDTNICSYSISLFFLLLLMQGSIYSQVLNCSIQNSSLSL